jgi:AcrR family transcriptional regulator
VLDDCTAPLSDCTVPKRLAEGPHAARTPRWWVIGNDSEMTMPRRLGADDSANHKTLLNAAQQLMIEEGYAAVTTRRVAARAGLKPQLVHYYFASMDDLLLALVRRATTRSGDAFARALASPKPLRALWEVSSDPDVTALTAEMMALANHRKAVKKELAEGAKRLRHMQVEALSEMLDRSGVTNDVIRPDALMVVIAAVSRVLVMEDSLGVSTGHENTLAMVEHFLAKLEGDPNSSR